MNAAPDAEALRARFGVPGLALVVVRAGASPRVSVAGFADLATGEPLRADTPLRWYSLTKPVVAAAVLRAAEDGLLELDAPVGAQLPAWNRDRRPRRATVTPRELLTHTAGLRDRQLHAARWLRDPARPRPESAAALRELLRRHRALGAARPRYSNLGYVTLGALLEQVHGAPLERLLEERLLRPWGAHATTLGAAPDAPLARGHLRRFGRLALALRLLTGDRFPEGRAGRHLLVRRRELAHPAHGGLVGPVGDLGRVLHGLLTGAGAPGEAPVLSAAARALQAAAAGVCSSREATTAGFFREPSAPERPGEPVLRHGGRGPGFTAELRLLPGCGLAVGVVGNADFDARAAAVQLARTSLAEG